MGIFEIYFFFSTKITIELFKLYNICIRNFSPIRGGIYNRCSKFSTETFYRDSFFDYRYESGIINVIRSSISNSCIIIRCINLHSIEIPQICEINRENLSPVQKRNKYSTVRIPVCVTNNAKGWLENDSSSKQITWPTSLRHHPRPSTLCLRNFFIVHDI